jgi:hypothetical protein
MMLKSIENEQDLRERRKKERTSFGPEEDEILYQMLKDRRQELKQTVK